VDHGPQQAIAIVVGVGFGAVFRSKGIGALA
jgi:hypothetical protein